MFESLISFKTECFQCGNESQYQIDSSCNIITLPRNWMFVKRNNKNIIVCHLLCAEELIKCLNESKENINP